MKIIYQSPVFQEFYALNPKSMLCSSPSGGQLNSWNVEDEENIFQNN